MVSTLTMRGPFSRLRGSGYWRDVAWLASGSTAAQALAFAFMPALTRLYSPQDFALQTLFVQIAGFAAVLLTWRFEFFIQLPKEIKAAQQLLWLVLCTSVGGALALTALVWPMRETLANMAGAPELAAWVLAIPLTAALMCLSQAILNFTQRQGHYRRAGLSELANKGSYVGSAMAGFWALPAPAGLMWATALGAAAKIALLWRGLHLGTTTAGGVRQVARGYLRLSGSMALSHLLMCGTAIIPSIFISRNYGTADLGQFALALSSIYIPTSLISNAIGQVYYQRAAQDWAAGQSFLPLWRSTSKRLVQVGLPLLVLISFGAPWLYPVIFGEVWEDAGRYAAILSVGAFFSFISTPLDRACLVVGAWRYIPLWHAARTLSTLCVAALAQWLGWSIDTFVVALTAQMSLMFLIDYRAEYLFARQQPSVVPT